MLSQRYELQILEKGNYSKEHIVPYEGSLPPLEGSSIRVQSNIIGLTTNNISYARLGDEPGRDFFAAHPLPFKEGIYSDSSKYARISAWGIGTIIDSTVSFVPIGTQIWGYLPIATLPVDKIIQLSKVKDVIIETTSHRQILMPAYNRYFVIDKAHAESKRFQAYSALIKVLFETSYALNRLCFPWDPKSVPVNPAGLHPKLDTWSREHANLRNAMVIIMPASSKTAFSFAYMLRFMRPIHEQPEGVIGISSAGSRKFCEETKLYDKVVLYANAESVPSKLAQDLGVSTTEKVILIDFGAREGVQDLWRGKLEAIFGTVVFIRVGTAIPERISLEEDEERRKTDSISSKPNSYSTITSKLHDAGMELYGEAEYLADLSREFDRFLEHDCIEALKPVWGQGMKGPDGVEGGWDRLCAGKMAAATGLVYRLP